MTGKTLAHFEIVAKLGEGGMGVIYEALDRHLDRHVALKILPPDKVGNSARKQRFIQEAKAASALNHPNIITIYDISAAEGVDYIAMELVHGRTLEEMLARQRPKIPETLQYAIQIADALAAAHAAGIVHRDLKPANIMIADNGAVKVLDLGLAKLADLSEVTETDATRTERAVTEEGTVMGSAPYMSPEQAEGKKVDSRSDIFSFGLVLYEMLSGTRAFRGASRMATMAAVLNQDPPPLGQVAPAVPKELERLVTRCLRKDLERRSQSMAEIKIALQELKEETESGASLSPVQPKTGSAWRTRWLLAGGSGLAVCAALFFLLPGIRHPAVPLKALPLTSYPGYQGQPTLSPDGSQFAFVWDGGQEKALPQLYVSLVGRGAPLQLTHFANAGVANPSWSPDGQTIAYLRATLATRESDLILIPALGGPACKIGQALRGSRPAWSPDGKSLYLVDRQASQTVAIFVQPSAGGDRHLFLTPPAGYGGDTEPAVSPDGRRLVFVRMVAEYNSDLFMVDLRDGNSDGPPRRLTTDTNTKGGPQWTPDGRDIVYLEGEPTSLFEVRRIPASGGPSSPMAGIGDYAEDLTVAPRGRRFAYSRSFHDWNIWRMPLSPAGNATTPASKLLASTRYEVGPAYSPDGKRIAFSSNRSGVRQIWVANADGSDPVALTNFTQGIAGAPKWSPDGQTIVFDARPSGLADIYSVKADGGTPVRLTDNPAEDHVPCYSGDGRWIFFASTRSGQRQLYRMPAGGGNAIQITQKGGIVPAASPDGRWVYYSTPGQGIWKVSVDGGEETMVLPQQKMWTSAFSFAVTPFGIYFAGPMDLASQSLPLMFSAFENGQTAQVGRFEKPLALGFSVSPDGKWLLFTQLDSSMEDLMLVENFH